MSEKTETAQHEHTEKHRSSFYAIMLCLAGTALAAALCVIGLLHPYGRVANMWIGLGFLVLVVAALFTLDYILAQIARKYKILVGLGIGVPALFYLVITRLIKR
jgi:lipopolysaccharide export LptBFGC system permease protein LptF